MTQYLWSLLQQAWQSNTSRVVLISRARNELQAAGVLGESGRSDKTMRSGAAQQ